MTFVALLTESVDRNYEENYKDADFKVALLTESVDRNLAIAVLLSCTSRRSPHGERG